MELVLILFVISVPIFYIKGLISFFSSDKSKGSQKNDRKTYLQTALKELKTLHDPTASIQTVVDRYTNELATLTASHEEKSEESISPAHESQKKQNVPVYQQDISEIWTNWYAHNSINLLLYVGALLIVSSAAIFLGFQWDTIAGTVKAGVLSLLTVVFFACGIWFFLLPKIKQAGITFIGIAALLLPINGAGWYQFVLKDLGVEVGVVWLLTSLIALIVYILFAHFFNTKVYAYIAGLSTLSLAFSLVKITALDQTFYILASILSCFMLFLTSLSIKKYKRENDIFSEPLAITSHIILPTSLAYGLFYAMDKHILFTFAGTLCVGLSALFYILSYVELRKSWFVLLIDILIPLTVFIACKWLDVDPVILLYLLAATSVLTFSALAFFYQEKKYEETNFLTVTGITKVIILFFAALSLSFEDLHLLIFSTFPIIYGRSLIFLQKRWEYFSLCAVFAAIALYILFARLLQLDLSLYYLGLLYAGIGVFFFLLSLSTKDRNTEWKAYICTTALFLFLGNIFTFTKDAYHLTTIIITAGVFLSSSYFFAEKLPIYAANALITYAVIIFLRILHIDYAYYPLVFITLYYLYYTLHSFLPEPYKTTYRNSALNGAGLTTAFFAISSIDAYSPVNNLILYSLISAYATTILFSLDAFMKRSGQQAYLASFIGLLTLLWHIHYLDITLLQAYTAPVGLYLLAIGYIRNRIQKKTDESAFTLGGTAFILLPSLVQSFGADNERYSLLLGCEGTIFIILGITINEKYYKACGVAALFLAIVSQTYQYVFALPRWLLVGIIGIVFLTVAIYLMQNKKDDHSSQ